MAFPLSFCQIGDGSVHEVDQRLGFQLDLQPLLAAADEDLVVQQGSLIENGGVFLLHTHRAAAAPYIAGQGGDLLDRNEFYRLFSHRAHQARLHHRRGPHVVCRRLQRPAENPGGVFLHIPTSIRYIEEVVSVVNRIT